MAFRRALLAVLKEGDLVNRVKTRLRKSMQPKRLRKIINTRNVIDPEEEPASSLTVGENDNTPEDANERELIRIERKHSITTPRKKANDKKRGPAPGAPFTVTSWIFRADVASACPFFFTNQAVYLLVFNLLTLPQRITAIDSWVQQIRQQTQTSLPAADILLVGTHRDDDQCSEEYLEHITRMLTERYPSNRYSQVRHILMVSCKTGKGFSALHDALEASAATIQPIVSPAWLVAHHHLQDLAAKVPFIPWKEYCEIAHSCGVSAEEIGPLTQFLGTTSTLLYQPEMSFVILDPLLLARFVISVRTLNPGNK